MKLTECPEMPEIPDPVKASLDCGLAYLKGSGPWVPPGGWPCDREFAEVVLATMEAWAADHWGGAARIVHLGIHAYRNVRSAGGRTGKRLSNHAYGRAIDWAGVWLNGKRLDPYKLEDNAPTKFADLRARLRRAAKAAGARLEWLTYRGVGTWLHVGLHPR